MPLSVNPNPMYSGEPATVTIANSSLPNQTITIAVSDGTNGGSLTVITNDQGIGSTTWTRPNGWGSPLTFSAPGVDDVTVEVQ